MALTCQHTDRESEDWCWRCDLFLSWSLAWRLMSIERGATPWKTLAEMYWLESRGGIP